MRPWFCGWAGLALSVLACLAVGGLGGLFTASSVSTWYPGLSKPSWTPPSGVFAPVWTTLYVTMGVALWLAWRARPESAGACSALFAVQLVLNLAWSVVFFGLRQPGWAVAEIVVLWRHRGDGVAAVALHTDCRAADGALSGVGHVRHSADCRHLADERVARPYHCAGKNWSTSFAVMICFCR
mgnify:CR=1 FL=1